MAVSGRNQSTFSRDVFFVVAPGHWLLCGNNDNNDQCLYQVQASGWVQVKDCVQPTKGFILF